MIGEILGHYRIVERIGAGGMGVVYRARDERLERDVALKVLAGEAVADHAALRRFRHEALALSRTSHPNIATVHDFDAAGDVHFLVMEYIPGQTLGERLTGGPLPEPEVVRLGQDLAAGLEAAHAQGVIHRDLKPSNLRITPDGRLKILDFGIARLRRASAETTHTDSGTRPIGTLPYMAPEQVRGVEADARSDIYSAGAVLYEMATGRRAHPGRQDAEVLDAVLYRTPTPPRETGCAISSALETCLLKALEKDPDRRHQSARELAGDLDRAAGSKRAGTHDRRGLLSRRTRLAMAGTLALAALALVARMTVFAPHESARPAAPLDGGRVKLAVLPAQNLSSNSEAAEWPMLIQALFAGELTGIQDIGVMDPLSLNSLVERAAPKGDAPRADRLAALLKSAGVDLVIDTQLVRTAGGYELRANLIAPASGEIRFSTRAPARDEQTLVQSVAALADATVGFLQVQVLDESRDRDVRPWISYRSNDIQAVKAFLQANQYIFRYQPGEPERYLRRAIELDPSFVAPRVWLLSVLLGRGAKADAEAQYHQLQGLESKASPFEQAIIAFVGAQLRGDLEAQAKHLEVALGYSPGNNILLFMLGGARVQQGDCRKALDALDPPVAARWPYPPLYPLWGWCTIAENRIDEARRVLIASLDLGPVDPNVYGLLDGLSIAANRPDEAARYARLYVQRSEELARPAGAGRLVTVYERLGSHCLATGAFEPAAALFQKAIDGAPTEAQHYDRLAEALTRLGRTADASTASARASALRNNTRR